MIIAILCVQRPRVGYLKERRPGGDKCSIQISPISAKSSVTFVNELARPVRVPWRITQSSRAKTWIEQSRRIRRTKGEFHPFCIGALNAKRDNDVYRDTVPARMGKIKKGKRVFFPIPSIPLRPFDEHCFNPPSAVSIISYLLGAELTEISYGISIILCYFANGIVHVPVYIHVDTPKTIDRFFHDSVDFSLDAIDRHPWFRKFSCGS